MRTFSNPILPGFYPDPSICRVNDDYYLVTSSFEYFPAVPIFHSNDLVHWRQIGHVLDRPSQVNLDGARCSGGIYAPTIRYHNGVFYMVTTLVDTGGHFFVTAADPTGPWSDPHWLPDAPEIDPSLFFDDDGRAWYVGNRVPLDGAQFEGHHEIWLQELDLETKQLTGERYGLWEGAVKGAVWAEAPHLYKVDNLYYLLISEAGTAHEHAVTIARSERVTGPYVGSKRNPLLTHRHLGWNYPIVNVGHADLVHTQNDEWWMVMLASRPSGGYYRNLGRETFLAPVVWEDGWPVVSPGTGRVEFRYPVPDLPPHPWPTRPACDQFESPTLDHCWNFLRTPRDDFWSLTERSGFLRLRLRPQKITEWSNPSFVGRRQQHLTFSARTAMEFTPLSEHDEAGIVLLQSSDFQFRMVVGQQKGRTIIQLITRAKGREEVLVTQPFSALRVYFKVEAVEQEYSFFYAAVAEDWQPLGLQVDGRILSADVAGGFVGAYIGMYAGSTGQPSDNVADFDWFEYVGG